MACIRLLPQSLVMETLQDSGFICGAPLPMCNLASPAKPRGYPTRVLRCVASTAVQEYREAPKGLRSRATLQDRRQVYTVQIRKPLGIVFREDSRGGEIVVDAIVPDGNASLSIPQISVGDRLMATTAEAVQNGTQNRTQTIMFKTDGEDFGTVMKAIQSNTCARCLITMVMEKGEGR